MIRKLKVRKHRVHKCIHCGIEIFAYATGNLIMMEKKKSSLSYNLEDIRKIHTIRKIHAVIKLR